MKVDLFKLFVSLYPENAEKAAQFVLECAKDEDQGRARMGEKMWSEVQDIKTKLIAILKERGKQ